MKINYSHLQEEYPAIITLEQLYQICHISKRKGRWLLENGVIPCQDSGKRTRRFRIRLKDVITYLEDTANGKLKVTVPSGIFSSNSTQVKHQKEQALLDSFRFPGFVKEAAHYYEKNFIKYPEALDTDMVSKMTGFGKSAVNNWIRTGRLKVYCRTERIIPKSYLLEFCVTSYYVSICLQSPKHKEDILCLQEISKKYTGGV